MGTEQSYVSPEKHIVSNDPDRIAVEWLVQFPGSLCFFGDKSNTMMLKRQPIMLFY